MPDTTTPVTRRELRLQRMAEELPPISDVVKEVKAERELRESIAGLQMQEQEMLELDFSPPTEQLSFTDLSDEQDLATSFLSAYGEHRSALQAQGLSHEPFDTIPPKSVPLNDPTVRVQTDAVDTIKKMTGELPPSRQAWNHLDDPKPSLAESAKAGYAVERPAAKPITDQIAAFVASNVAPKVASSPVAAASSDASAPASAPASAAKTPETRAESAPKFSSEARKYAVRVVRDPHKVENTTLAVMSLYVGAILVAALGVYALITSAIYSRWGAEDLTFVIASAAISICMAFMALSVNGAKEESQYMARERAGSSR